MRRMVLMGPVVLVTGALAACSHAVASPTSSGSLIVLPSDIASQIGVSTLTPSTAPTSSVTSSAPQQTGEANPSPFVTPTIPNAHAPKPTCTTVWTAGGTLPKTYRGCTGGPKADEQHLDCNNGSKLWIRNLPDGSEYWAFAGKEINHSKDPNADAAATGKCMS